MKKTLGITSSALNIVVSLLPYPWWFTNFGGIIKIYSNPFYIEVNLLGNDYSGTLLLPMNLLLLGLRAYVIVFNAANIYLILKNRNKISLFIFWASIAYIIDPIIILLISILIFNHPILVLGEYELAYAYSGYNINMLIENYPLFPYYVAIIAGILSVIYKIKFKVK